MIGRTVNPVLLERALFTFLDERLETHARELRAVGATEDTIDRGMECYRSRLLAALLKIVIKNGPEWFGSDDWRTALGHSKRVRPGSYAVFNPSGTQERGLCRPS